MCFEQDDYATVYNDKVVKARKLLECVECADKIRPGEHYKRMKYLFEGEWHLDRICARCYWDHERVYLHEISEGCAPYESRCYTGYLHEHMSELEKNARFARSNFGEIDETDDPTGWEPSPITYRVTA